MKKSTYIISLFVFALFFSISALVSSVKVINAFADEKPQFTNVELENFCEDSLLVTLKPGVSLSYNLENYFYGLGVSSIKDLSYFGNNVYPDKSRILKLVFEPNGKQHVLDLIDTIENEAVLYAETNQLLSFASTYPTITDPFFADERYLSESGINAISAWQITKGNNNIRVGVIDSGIAYHDDLEANVDRTLGYDFVNDDTITTDDVYVHGTQVAGVLGALNNNIGVTGVCPNITLVPLQVYRDSTNVETYCNLDAVIEAICYAASLWDTSNRISLLNISISNFVDNHGHSRYSTVATALSCFPGLCVLAAGNDDECVDDIDYFSSLDLPNVVIVGALNENDTRADGRAYGNGSNYGDLVNVYAYGDFYELNRFKVIYTTILNNGYGYFGGTSAATPQVTATAALMLSANPSLTASELKDGLIDTAKGITVDVGDVLKLDTYAAVKSVAFRTNVSGNTITGVNFEPYGEFRILDNINNTTVTSIAAGAFAGCDEITSVVIEDNIWILGNAIFSGCTSLETVYILDDRSVVQIGSGCFLGASSNLTIYVPKQLENSYKTATYWSSYANNIVGAYLIDGRYYLPTEDTVEVTVDGEDVLQVGTLGGVNIEYWGSFSADIAYIDYMDDYFYRFADCYFYSDYVVMESCIMRIDNTGYSDDAACYLFDTDFNYISDCYVVDGCLEIDIADIILYGESHFYLLPINAFNDDDSIVVEPIEFCAEDVEFEISYYILAEV